MSLRNTLQFPPISNENWRSLFRQRTRIREIFGCDTERQVNLIVRRLLLYCDGFDHDPTTQAYRKLLPSKRIELLQKIGPASIRLANILDQLDPETLDALSWDLPSDDTDVSDLSAYLRQLAKSSQELQGEVERPVRGRRKNSNLHEWVEGLASLYNKETGFNPTKPSVSVKSKGRGEVLTGDFYSLCKIVLEIQDPESLDKLPNVVEQVSAQWGKQAKKT